MQALKRPLLLTAAAVLLSACAPGSNPVTAIKEKVSSPGDTRPIIAELTPGPYQPSSLAQGVDKDMAQRRSTGSGFVHADALERYLQGIRGRLLDASGVTDVPGRIRILAEGDLTAFSTPDGNVYVAMGWFDNFGSEDEVAALMAHELSHVLRKHHTADLMLKSQKQGEALMSYGLEGKKAAMNLGNQLQGKPATDTDASKSDQAMMHRMHAAVSVTEKAIGPAWGRTQEREADLLGIDLLVKAGYNQGAMLGMLNKLKAVEPQQIADDKARADQMTAASNEAAKGSWDSAAKLAFSSQLSTMAQDHPPVDARIDDAGAYIRKYYAQTPPPLLSTASWQKVYKDAQSQAILGNFAKALSAEQMIATKGDAKQAYALARQAVSGPTARESYINWVASITAEANNAKNDQRRYLLAAIAAPEPVNAAFLKSAADLEDEGKLKQALTVAEQASGQFSDAANWKVIRIRLLRKSGNASAAKDLEVDCGLHTPDYKSDCSDAGNTPLGKPTRS